MQGVIFGILSTWNGSNRIEIDSSGSAAAAHVSVHTA